MTEIPLPPPRRRPAESFRMARVVFALIMREMSTTYGRSAGGYLWAVLEPIGAIVLLTIAFSLFLRSPPIGDSFALFYATGLLPFLMFMSLANKIGAAVRFSGSLLTYPRLTLIDAIVARLILNTLTHILVFFIVISGIIFVEGLAIRIDVGTVVLGLFMAVVLGAGIGVLNCLLNEIYPVWGNVWKICTRPLVLASCIFYTFDGLPETVQVFLWFNPLVHVVGIMRDGFFQVYSADYVSVSLVFATAGIPAVIGLHFLRIYHKRIINDR